MAKILIRAQFWAPKSFFVGFTSIKCQTLLQTSFKTKQFKQRNATYESHRSCLTKCYKDKIISQGLSIYIKPSIGNQDSKFLKACYERLQAFCLKLLSDIIKLCGRTTENVTEGIEKTKRELNQQLNYNESGEAIAALQQNIKLNKKHPEQ